MNNGVAPPAATASTDMKRRIHKPEVFFIQSLFADHGLYVPACNVLLLNGLGSNLEFIRLYQDSYASQQWKITSA